MGFLEYLRSRVHAIVIELVGYALVRGLLGLMGLPGPEANLAVVLMLFFTFLALLVDWLVGRDFLSEMDDVASSGRDALALASELRDPPHREGHLLWRAMSAVTREAQRRIGELRVREEDYRDYVETWVHEIKTPLAAVDLMLDNLSGINSHPLRREIDQVGGYVEQALYYARSTAVENDFSVRPCELQAMVRDAVKSRAAELIGAGVTPDLSGIPAEGCRAMADQKWVTFMLGQLIDNAVHYRREDPQVPSTVTFVAHLPQDGGEEGERVLLDVRDNGCGIPASDIGRVFDKGFTGENGRLHKKSTGIGLYLVKTMCDRMGMGVMATSLPGSWTCITLSFPRADASEMLREAGPLA